MRTLYETDILAWANEQAALLRTGKLSAIDALKIAEEIEDVGKSEQRELASRLGVLLAHLLKWQSQPEFRSKSWFVTINLQRSRIARRLRRTPSLNHCFDDDEFIDDMWDDAAGQATQQTGLADFSTEPRWSIMQILDPTFFPGD